MKRIVDAIIEKSDNNYAPDDMALIFSTIESHSLNPQSNITDYWLEDKTAVQDCIGIQPLQISLSGLVADIEYKNTSLWTSNILSKINNISKEKLGFTLTDKLGVVASLVPEVDNYTQLAKDAVKQVEDVYNNLKSKINRFVGNKTKTNQQKQVEWLIKAWQGKVALKVTMPFGVFDNMYILSAPIVQENTNTITKVTVTLKQLNIANSTIQLSSSIKAEDNRIVSVEITDNGVMKTVEMSNYGEVGDGVVIT